jgi:CubicO group peptidase (beta-lactamase class C family)
VKKKQAAGFVALVARKGKVVYHEAFGTRGLSNADPMTKDALFDLASMTKPVTVAAGLMLLEEGKITLDGPVSEYLPEFRELRVERSPGVFQRTTRAMTVRSLFNHTSGVFTPKSRAEMFEFPTLGDFVRDLAKQPVRHEPGTRYLYGTSHDVLGYLVEKVSGMGLNEYVESRILRPLGMNDTYYWPAASEDKRRAVLVVNGKDDPKSLSRVPPGAAERRSYYGGASGLYSTAGDYWKLAQMYLNGGTFGGKRLLGPATVEWMAENHIGDMDSFTTPGTRFGLGMAVVTERGASGLPYSKGTYYWSGSQGTLFWVDPHEELIGVLMVQLTPSPLRLRERFSALAYGAIVD